VLYSLLVCGKEITSLKLMSDELDSMSRYYINAPINSEPIILHSSLTFAKYAGITISITSNR
jgi:hypothetical protein